MAETAVAHAPVPQARVSPAPLSHTRIVISLGFSTKANSTLVLFGNTGWFSINGPYFATAKFFGSSSRNMTA